MAIDNQRLEPQRLETPSLSDVSNITLGERIDHYRKQYGVYALPIMDERTIRLNILAEEAARDEFLQEIHTMLLYLISENLRTKKHTESQIQKYGLLDSTRPSNRPSIKLTSKPTPPERRR